MSEKQREILEKAAFYMQTAVSFLSRFNPNPDDTAEADEIFDAAYELNKKMQDVLRKSAL